MASLELDILELRVFNGSRWLEAGTVSDLMASIKTDQGIHSNDLKGHVKGGIFVIKITYVHIIITHHN